MNTKQIAIRCTGAAAVPYAQLTPFQGQLKTLSEANYQKLKRQILKLGFSEPISVWLDPEDRNCILNGHQRLTTIRRMVEQEGYECPPLPISYVEADTWHQAKEKVLALAGAYGTASTESVAAYLTENDIDLEEAKISFDIPGVNFDEIVINHEPPAPPVPPEGGEPRAPTMKNFNIAYSIAFDDLEQQAEWFRFLKHLKQTFPEPPTIGAKLTAFVRGTLEV